ncbi:hypothetical protein SK803_10670 [Lentzea sp. BCCO 10_0856]|uniref:HTH cro/C1-type domain-containing protein n=1 Tax=Lentzea miocenica TaxID=3095431 RepID=A0ABU4SXP5_9PSEU|nr:hypothetical protein [Lentzea sp. BCCO 10_0856]MDX8030676.1 hypothetical protein [Lentzea sp. BCCO 10_0856]
MPRPERPLDSDDDELLRFAADLRLLREKAGKPTYRELSKVAHYSVTVLSEAASGRKLPSLAVTTAYVHACGGDVEQWRRRWHAVAEGAKPADPEREPPYLGLGAFQAEDSRRFFGREKLVAQLLEKCGDRPFVGVFGASGSGKSSLLRAGLVASRPADVFSPGPHPMALWGGTTAELVVIDQFEEVFTLCRDEDERVAFIDAITTAHTAATGRKVVIGVRSDFYGHCGRYPALVDALHDAQILVGAMSPQELRRAITEPALRAGYTVEGALVSVLEAEHAPLPLVSHALLETWRRRRGTRLTVAGYEETGGVRHALAQSAEAAYLALDSEQQAIARKIFLRLTALGEGTEDTKRRVNRESLDNDDDTLFVLDHLARARLITLDDTSVDLAHEAVIRSWPRLSGWLTANRDGLRVHHQITEATATWESLNHDSGALYRGVRLALAREWATGDADEMSARERRFLDASIEAEEAEQETARRGTRRLRQLVALLTVLLVLAVTAVGYAIRASDDATTQRNIAIARKAVTDAKAVQPLDSQLAAQLSLSAHQLADNTETSDNLASTPAGPYFTRLAAHSSDIPAVAIHGTTLATVSVDRTAKLWDITDNHRPAHLSTVEFDYEPGGIALGRQSHLLAVTGRNAVKLFDTTDPRDPRLAGQLVSTTVLRSAVFNDDGTLLLTAHDDGAARLWDVADPARPTLSQTLAGNGGEVKRAVFRPDGRAVAIVIGSTVTLWSLDGTPSRQGELAGHTQPVESLAFSPDGRTLGTGGWDHVARLWDVSDLAAPRSRAVLTGSTAIVWGVSFSPDGKTFVTTGDERTRLWSVTEVALSGSPRLLGTIPGGVFTGQFTQDGTTLVIDDAPKTLRLQDMRELPLIGHENIVSSVAFHPGGQVLASGSWDGTVFLWRMTARRTREPIARISDATAFIRFVAFSPDGTRLAVASDDGYTRLYDVTNPAAPVLAVRLQPRDHQTANVSLAFTPDGRTLAVGSEHTLTVWGVADLAAPQELFRRSDWYASVWAVGFSPDGTRLIAGGRGEARLFDATDRRALKEIPFPGGGDAAMADGFSGDGRLLATAIGDSAVRLIDTSTSREVAQLTGFSDVAYSAAFHGTRLATSHGDGKVRLWDVTDPARPRLETTYSGHEAPVPSLAFSPDGTYLASGSNDTTIRLWEVGAGRSIARLCERNPAPLTSAQWEEHFPDVPYRQVCR